MLWLYLKQAAYNIRIAHGLHVKTTTRKPVRLFILACIFYHCAIYLVKCSTVSMLFVWCSVFVFFFKKHINSVSYQMLSSLLASLCLRSHQWLYQTAHQQCKP